MNNLFLSIIMPALNEEKNITAAITKVLKGFDDFKVDGELVIINDGSSDGTPKMVKQLMSSEKRISLLNHDTLQGIGASFWDGVSNAKGAVVCMLPGDNENEPAEIFRYLKLLDDADIVIPFAYNKRTRSLFRNIISYVFIAVINFTFNVNFNYTNGTILYRKSILSDISYRSRGFLFQADILVRLTKRGYLFTEVPYRLGLRASGKSKAVKFSTFLQVTRDYLRLVRDIYLKSGTRLKRYKFSEDSISLKRYKDLTK